MRPTSVCYAIKEVIRDSGPFASGIIFDYIPDGENVVMSIRNPYAGDAGLASRDVGGIGITFRPYNQLRHFFPTLEEDIAHSRGMVAFIGNGFSPAPIEAASASSSQVCVIDGFDYIKAHRDLTRVRDNLLRERLPFPMSKAYVCLDRLVESIGAGTITQYTHFFGSGYLPENICRSGLVVNSYGPPSSTIAEQLMMLEVGGVLLLRGLLKDMTNLPVPEGFLKHKPNPVSYRYLRQK